MIWANPEFFLFIPLAILALIFFFKIAVKHRARLVFPLDWSAKNSAGKMLTPFRFQAMVRFLALCALIVALARPQKKQENEKRVVEAIDLLVVLDLSKSMDALDYTPNRHTVAVNTLERFITHRPDDRIGLVLFSGEAYLNVPLTLDHKLVLEALKSSSTSDLEDGTAIGQAIAVAVNHLKKSTAKSRVIVLVTDGDNNMGSVSPASAAEIAAGYGIKIYTIGIGKPGRAPYPVTFIDAFGQKHQTMQYVTDAVNVELMQKICSTTGGKYYSGAEEAKLDGIYDDINSLEKSKVEVFKQVHIAEKADTWMLIGLALLFFEGFALQTLWRKFP